MSTSLPIINKVIADMGGTIEEFVPERGCYYIKLNGKRILLERDISITRQSFISSQFTRCKEMTNKLLIANNLPALSTECFYNKTYDRKEAIKKLQKITYPIILKSAVGSNSLGIFPYIETPEEATKVLQKNLPRYRSMIAQKMVFGKEYRVLVLGSKIIGALEMIRPHVIGDGKTMVRKLIREKQKTTRKRTPFDKKLKHILKDQKVTLDTVLAKNKLVYIKRNASLAEGGETKDVTTMVHKDVKDICVSASKTVGKYLAGIDIICSGIEKKPSKRNFHILEINGRPDMYIHYEPTHGKIRNVLKDVIKYLDKQSSPLSSRVK